mmetsp:Transcript_34291/g.54943  ORF Transcript_34291/g.54943 Transcript_34291/m.54943 type:complete len:1183 (+) Transcript_34291:132-3680(+)
MEESALCRVCQCGEDVGPLFYPCKCKGSIRYIHEDCLVKWLRVSNKRACELCLTEFQFQPVYMHHTPARLSKAEVVLGLIQLGIKNAPEIARKICVGLIWLFVFPMLTCRVHYLFFARTFEDVVSSLSLLKGIEVWLKDCVFGVFLSGCIVCGFLALVVLQDYRNDERRQDRNLADRVVGAAVAAAADANGLVDGIQAAREEGGLVIAGLVAERVGAAVAAAADPNGLVEGLQAVARERTLVDSNGSVESDRSMSEDMGYVTDTDESSYESGTENQAGDDLSVDVLIGLRRGVFTRGFYTMSLVVFGNTVFLFVFQLLPFNFGRLLLWSRGVDTENKLYILFIGVIALVSCGIGYFCLKKFSEIWKGRSSADAVTNYVLNLCTALLRLLQMGTIMFLELFFLCEMVGWMCHIGIMGTFGNFSLVFATRVEMCRTSPLTCVGIHWAVGSVVIANWSGLIWTFRQVVHPYFRLRMFHGWYDTSKKLQVGMFSRLLAMNERRTMEENSKWKKLVETVEQRVRAQRRGRSKSMARSKEQAPVAEPEIENSTVLNSMVSTTLEESISYVVTVFCWSIPAAIVFLVVPISFINWTMPWIFPLRIGTFREPFSDAQLPLDMFLFHSLPITIEKLGLNVWFLDLARLVGRLLTKPLDLEGYVMKPSIEGMQSGFVHVDLTRDSSYINTSDSVKRRILAPLCSISSLKSLSSECNISDSVDILGVVCAAVPPDGIGLHSDYVFAVADSLGYCVPVFVEVEISQNERANGKLHAESRMMHLNKMYPKATPGSLIADLRRTREKHRVDPSAIDAFYTNLPQGMGAKWSGHSPEKLASQLYLLSNIWKDENSPPVIAIKGATVSGKYGRSICLTEESTLLLEPDSGVEVDLALISFHARRTEASVDGQFCVLRHEPSHVDRRLAALGFCTVLAAIFSSTTAIVIPLVCGRRLFSILGDPLEHDVYHWGGGFLVLRLWGTLGNLFYTKVFHVNGDVNGDGGWKRALELVLTWVLLGIKWLFAILLCGIILPILAGTLFELVVLNPLLVPADRTPVHLMFQNWAMGLALLNVWSGFLSQQIFGESNWPDKFETLQRQGGYGLQLRWIIREIVSPIATFLLIRMCTPYMAVRIVERIFDLDPLQTEFAMRFAYPVFLGWILLRNTFSSIFTSLDLFHDKIRDNRYRIGRRLRNTSDC